MLEALKVIDAEADGEDEIGDGAGDEGMGGSEVAAREVSGNGMSAMQHAGMPYYEEMVENTRIGRIKRQKGGHTSRDGRTTVEWEVVEIGGEAPTESAGNSGSSKRQKLGA